MLEKVFFVVCAEEEMQLATSIKDRTAANVKIFMGTSPLYGKLQLASSLCCLPNTERLRSQWFRDKFRKARVGFRVDICSLVITAERVTRFGDEAVGCHPVWRRNI